ncbi:hypothetical protein SDC9_134583 [bioreactor metagenome]|uniref:Uncharacterized protein n=1 Tax=bioreactor metagenome TaxID=1076179 RepID=A0A645DE12_9ZZZZ
MQKPRLRYTTSAKGAEMLFGKMPYSRHDFFSVESFKRLAGFKNIDKKLLKNGMYICPDLRIIKGHVLFWLSGKKIF